MCLPVPTLIFNQDYSDKWNDTSRPNASNVNETGNDANIDYDSAIKRFRSTSTQRGPSTTPRPLCDDRLANLKISFWTNVQIPDGLAAEAISLYLETDHPLLGTFNPSRFIGDLVDHRKVTCSTFLVNVLLYWGCVGSYNNTNFDITEGKSAKINSANVQRRQ